MDPGRVSWRVRCRGGVGGRVVRERRLSSHVFFSEFPKHGGLACRLYRFDRRRPTGFAAADTLAEPCTSLSFIVVLLDAVCGFRAWMWLRGTAIMAATAVAVRQRSGSTLIQRIK